jgi:hypothetical protein
VAHRAGSPLVVEGPAATRAFESLPWAAYRHDPNWVPPLPGEDREAFAPRRNPALRGIRFRRWVLQGRDGPVGRIAAFTSRRQPEAGYFGFFECDDRQDHAERLLRTAEEWLAGQGCRTCHGPIAGVPRDRLGLLIEGFDRPALLFTPYNPPFYGRLLERAGYDPGITLRAYGWDSSYGDPRRVTALAARAERGARVRIRPIRVDRLSSETRLIAGLINQILAEAWHFDPIGEEEAAAMARQLRPILDPAIALVAEDDAGPCGVALAVPDVNWLWRRAGGRIWPLGWLRVLRWYRRIPQARLMALGLAQRVQGTGVAVRLIARMHHAGLTRGYVSGELSQVFDDNLAMRRILDGMRLPVVRRYAIYSRALEAG